MKRVLVIEDHSALRQLLCETLVQAGYDAVGAADGREASALYQANVPQIIVTDIYMPNRDGLETIIHLREHFPEVKILAMSGGVSKSHILEVARTFGADNV